MTRLKTRSLDYYINSGAIGINYRNSNDTSMFFLRDIGMITTMKLSSIITEKFHISIDEILVLVKQEYPFFSTNTIVSSLVHLWKNNYLLFVPKFGIHMKLVINDGMLFLVSSGISGSSLTYSDTINTNIATELTFVTPDICEEDVRIIVAYETRK